MHGGGGAPATDLDLTDARFVDDPYPAFARLRSTAPLHRHERTGMLLAVSRAAVDAVLRDRALGRVWRDREPASSYAAFNALHRHQMMENEPPEHTRLRGLVAQAFSRGRIDRLRPRVQAIVDGLLDAMADKGGRDGAVDLLADFAEPLPVAVIAELLGVPEDERAPLRPWSQAIVRMYEYGRTSELEAAAERAAREFAAYMRELAADRRRAPRDDLVSALVQAEEHGKRLTEDELVASAILLLNAGHEASVNGFGNGVVALLRHPQQLALLRADLDGGAEVAVEEMLRYDAPLQLFERTATAEVEVEGVRVAAGTKVAALLGAANRDPAAVERPDEFDVTRTSVPHVSFGAGVHFCLGAPLARMELQTSLPALLRRFPRLALAGEPERRPTLVLRGYRTVPATL